MKNKLVMVPSIAHPIMPAPGFQKKRLADYKLDLLALCGFGCTYCSSNEGNYLRINRERFADLAETQLGERLYPHTSPELMMVWPDVLEKLEAQVRHHARTATGRKLPPWGTGQTLVFSMLTDGFSPVLVGQGVTEKALRLVLEHTGFRVRVLTKNAVIGTDRWARFFADHPGRFVVGLSCGTLSGGWAANVEVGTSSPAARLGALRALQDAGIPTFGMLCPIFPDLLVDGGVEQLVSDIRPALCEHVWAEPYNDRANWRAVRDGYPEGSTGWQWLTDTYGAGKPRLWSAYAADLYERLLAALYAHVRPAEAKLRYLLYEDGIAVEDAPVFDRKPGRGALAGVLLQSKPIGEGDREGYSQNTYIAALQRAPGHGRITAPGGAGAP